MNKIGRFGEYGGQYVPEIVMNAVNELNEAYEIYKNDPEFLAQLRQLYRDYWYFFFNTWYCIHRMCP